MKAICIAAEKEIKANINKVRLNEIINLTNFATTSYTKEIDIIPLIRSHLLNGPVYTTDFRDALIRKLVEVGITDVEIMKRMFNIRQKVTSKYIYEAVTALADLRFENEIWALDFVRDLVNMAQKNEIIYDDETQVLNLIWSLTRFKIKDQFFDRMMTNFSNIDNKNLSFKRILLAHHSGTDSNLFNLEGMNDFDWTQKFGIGRNFLNPFKKLLDKNNYDNLDNQVINDLWVPLYVPVNKTVIWPISKAACLYKSNRLRGEFETYKEIVEKKVGKLVIVSNEMVSNFDESKTLNLLARSGFKNNHS